MKTLNYNTDFLVIGSGLAGLFAAYHASKFGKVTVVTKYDYKESSSWYAQGGIAAAFGKYDSPSLHFQDTITAGRGLCDNEAVNTLVNEGKEAVKELINLGMDFDKDGNNILFGLEGGHSVRRVLHASGSATGQQVVKFLIEKISAIPNVKFHYNTQAFNLFVEDGVAKGCAALNLNENRVINISANHIIIAAGGYSRMYARSTNPDSAIGEGIWLAAEAGAKIRDMEFVQFHPTAFYSPNGETFLISEAVRGEGAYLRDTNGKRFMKDIHELSELAPRDIVAKSIYNVMKSSNSKYVYLDLRHLDGNKIKSRFSNIVDRLEENGIDFRTELIPIAPAAHYSVGGIETDLNGKTNIDNLYACGECASTGVHGANRLASNSLLECLVFSKRAVKYAVRSKSKKSKQTSSFINEIVVAQDAKTNYEKLAEEISITLNESAGILRNGYELYSSLVKLTNIEKEISGKDYYSIISKGMIKVAKMILRASIERRESRGVHQRMDYPETNNEYLGRFAFINDELLFQEYHGNTEKVNFMGKAVN